VLAVQPPLAQDALAAALDPNAESLPGMLPLPAAASGGAAGPGPGGVAHVPPVAPGRSSATVAVTSTSKKSAAVAPRAHEHEHEHAAARPLASAAWTPPGRASRDAPRESEPAASTNEAPLATEELPTAATMTPFTPPVSVPTAASALSSGVSSSTAKLRGASALEGGADGDATANAIRNAEAVGHRRVLAGEAHGSLSVEDLGRFEVSARTSEDGRVDVQVRAQHRDGAALLEHHAAELRADVRIEVPRAFVAVQDASHGARDASASGNGAQPRSSDRDSGGRDDRSPTDPREPPRREPASTSASPLPSAGHRTRVKVVL